MLFYKVFTNHDGLFSERIKPEFIINYARRHLPDLISLDIHEKKLPSAYEAMCTRLLAYSCLFELLNEYIFNGSLKTLPAISTDLGKPYFPDYPNLFFNISHTNGGVCAVVSDRPVGIDIEHLREWSDVSHLKRLIHRVCNDNDTDNARVSCDDSASFLTMWVIKEGAVKAEGCGISVGLRNVVIDYDNGTVTVMGRRYSYKLIEQGNGFYCCYCQLIID